MVNIEYLVVLYFISLFVDWIFQWQWQATNKSKWGDEDNLDKSFIALLSHSVIYALLSTTLLSLLVDINALQWVVTYVVLLLSHLVIDSRAPVKVIMKFKGMTEEQINDYQNYGFMHIGIDHRLHELALLMLACFM